MGFHVAAITHSREAWSTRQSWVGLADLSQRLSWHLEPEASAVWEQVPSRGVHCKNSAPYGTSGNCVTSRSNFVISKKRVVIGQWACPEIKSLVHGELSPKCLYFPFIVEKYFHGYRSLGLQVFTFS